MLSTKQNIIIQLKYEKITADKWITESYLKQEKVKNQWRLSFFIDPYRIQATVWSCILIHALHSIDPSL